ncbi:MAG: hypothetical protein ACJ0QD_02305 [Flavobacteriaceae bacterium]
MFLKGLKTLELGARGSFGRSADVAISEYGFDIQLRAPPISIAL